MLDRKTTMHEQISEAVIQFREENKIPQSDCAKALGMSNTEYSAIEHSDKEWTEGRIDAISKFFGYEKEFLISDAEELSKNVESLKHILARITRITENSKLTNRLVFVTAIEIISRHGLINELFSRLKAEADDSRKQS